MNHLWSPWRMPYIQSKKSEACVFCEATAEEDSQENLVVYRGGLVFAILNRFPYTSGHLMVVPYSHIASLQGLDAQTRGELMEVTNVAAQVLAQAYSPQGFNLGMNLGEVAGAGITDHVHLHVVPRWGGDTNFMSAVAETRVLPESLADTYEKIRQTWREWTAQHPYARD